MQEMDLRDTLYLLLAKLKYIILCLVIGAFVAGAYSHFFIEEKYTSSILVYISNREGTVDVQTSTTSSLSAAERLVKTYQVAMGTDTVLKEAVSELNNAVTVNELKSMLTSSQEDETAFLRISVTHHDPELAKRACEVVANVSVNSFSKIGEIGSALVIEEEASKAIQTAPNTMRTSVVGGIIGMVLSIIFIIMRHLFDNTIGDKEKIRERIDIPVLGEIPSFEIAAKGGKTYA